MNEKRPITSGEVLLSGVVLIGFAFLAGAYLLLNGLTLLIKQ